MANMLYGCTSLKSISGLELFDTSNVTNMTWMFGQCNSLTAVDLSSFDTAKLTSLDYMFYNCAALTSLDLSFFDTAGVTSMKYTFGSCTGLTSLNLSGWNTAAVTNWDRAFYRVNCNVLASNDSVALAETPAGSITPGIYIAPQKVYAVFDSGNKALVFLRSFKTNVPWPAETRAATTSVIFTTEVRPVSTYAWFYGCAELTTITNLKNLNTADVTTMAYMFRECSSLTSLDLSGFNTAKVNSMQSMFTGDAGLEQLDLSGFTMSAVEDISYMLRNCTGLTSLDLNGWDTGAVEVTSISVQGISGSGWTLANSIDASTTPVNSKIFSMSVEANGEIASEGRKTVSYSAAIPAQSEAVAATEIARVVFTIAWAEAA